MADIDTYKFVSADPSRMVPDIDGQWVKLETLLALSNVMDDLESKLARAERLIRGIEQDAENATEFVLCDMYARRGEDIKYLLSFAPNDPTPEGLDPTFYHTLTYEGDKKIESRVSKIRAALQAGDKTDG